MPMLVRAMRAGGTHIRQAKGFWNFYHSLEDNCKHHGRQGIILQVHLNWSEKIPVGVEDTVRAVSQGLRWRPGTRIVISMVMMV